MANSFVLHIGDPKTGTTSIQEILLRRQFDSPTITVDYPDQLNSFPLANALCDPKQAAMREPRFKALAQWLSDSRADVAIVSAEQFFRVDPRKLQDSLDEFVSDYSRSARIVAYVRPHVSRLISAYLQRTRSGLFMDNLDKFFEATKNENLLHYAPRFNAWRQVFGERFTLRPMIREELRDGDVVSDFLSIALSGAPFKVNGRHDANTSLSLEFLSGLREVQRVLKRNQVAMGTRNLVGDQVGRTLFEMGIPTGTKVGITKHLYKSVHKFCTSDAAELDAAFFGKDILTKALDDAAETAIDHEQINASSAYYSIEEVEQLRRAGRKLTTLFQQNPTAWPLTFERRIGQRPPPKEGSSPRAQVQNATRVDETLEQIAAIIAKSTTKAAS